MAEAAKDEKTQPGWGKVFGVFILTYAVSFTSCMLATLLIPSEYGPNIYIAGGLLYVVLGAICAAAYRRGAKVSTLAIVSIMIGIAIGIAVELAYAAMTPRDDAGNPTTSSIESQSQESTHGTLSSDEAIAMCATDEARNLIAEGRFGYDWYTPDIDPALQRVTFGNISTGSGSSKPHWEVGYLNPIITSDQSAKEVINAVIGQMCGSGNGASESFVRRAYEMEDPVAQIDYGLENYGFRSPVVAWVDEYEIDGKPWYVCVNMARYSENDVLYYEIEVYGDVSVVGSYL